MSAMVDAGGRFERGVGAVDDHAEAVASGRPHQAAGPPGGGIGPG